MVAVPRITDTEVQLRPVTDARYEVTDRTAGARAIGGGLEQLGGAMGKAANNWDDANAVMDTARAKQHDNSYQDFEREVLFGEDGYYKKQNADAINARKDVEQRLQQKQQELLAQAQSPRERKMLSDVFQSRRNQAFEGIDRHAQTESVNYAKVQSNTRIVNATDNYVRFADDPVRSKMELQTINSEVDQQAQLFGIQDPDIIKRMHFDATSKAHKGVVEAKMLTDVPGAASYFNTNRDQMDADTQNSLERELQPKLVGWDAHNIAKAVGGEAAPGVSANPAGKPADPNAPKVIPAPINASAKIGQMIDITMHVGEGTGGKDRYSDGRVITSPKGASGRMQVMPTTITDPGYHIQPSDGSLEDTARVGRQYLVAMMKEYKGDPARAWAAYNWGPGNLNKAIAKWGPNWLDHAPKETRDYVARNLKALGMPMQGGQVDIGTQTHGGPDLASQLASVDNLVKQQFADKPAYYQEMVAEAAKAEVKRNWGEARQAEAEVQNHEADKAWEVADGLGDNFTSVSQLPNYGTLAPNDQHSFRLLARNNAERATAPREVKTDPVFFSKISDDYARDPKSILNQRPEVLARVLGKGDFDTVMGWRRDAIGGGQDKTPKQIAVSTVMSISTPLLNAAGIKTGESKDARADAPKVVEFQRAMMTWQEGYKAQHGKYPDEDEVRKQADRFLIRGHWQDANGEHDGYAYQAPGMTMTQFNIPRPIYNRIKAAVPDASDAAITRIYIEGKGTRW